LALLPLVAACGGGGSDSSDSIDDGGTTSTSVRIGTSTSPGTSTSSTAPSDTSPTAPSEGCDETLERGCRGDDVEVLQRLLRGRVDGSVDVDGDFDEATERALREFEDRRCGVCVVDGRIQIDGAEWKELLGLRSTTTVRPRELSP
jgi:peptidoglycan hydrolase-like protein with peptidoglycan-binding domain